MKKLLFLLLACNSCWATDGWQRVEQGLWRMRVPTGWIVTYYNNGITFVADEKHEWKL